MHQYIIDTITDDDKLGTITIPVVPARKEPDFGFFASMGASRREYAKERTRVLTAVNELIAAGSARRHRGSLSLSDAQFRVSTYETSTLAVIAKEFDREGGPEELLGFLDDHKRMWNEPKLRELAAYGRHTEGIHHQMLTLLLNELRASHPLFAREDLSELKWADRETFLAALEFIRRIYEATTFVIWKDYEKCDWSRYVGMKTEALRKVPRIDLDLLDAVLKSPERMDSLVKKAIGWNPVLVMNNAKAFGGRIITAPMKMLRLR